MKLYVEKQDMPQNCAECKAEGHYENSYGDEYGFFCPFGYKAYTSGTRDTKRLDNCPLIPAPPHGRCIDADAFIKRMNELVRQAETDGFDLGAVWYTAFIRHIELAPTIIPASEEGET